MARPSRREEDQGEANVSPKAIEPTQRVRITALKVFTRHGRFIAGQYVDIPASEAAMLVSEGKAQPC